MIFQFQNSEPRWINFENPTGTKGGGAICNHGAKGHAFEHFEAGEEKVLCDFDGCGVIRRLWITLNDRSPEVLQNVYLKMIWDHAPVPQVFVPIGDFFCMGLGTMRSFENHFFTTAEGRSFSCTIPMPFLKNARILLWNNSGKYINNLFYDINLTLEPLSDNVMHFCTHFQDLPKNQLAEDISILPLTQGAGRFLGANIAVIPDETAYPNLWWGEGEVKIYLDGDSTHPTLAGTGAEDYVGSAWELGEFINEYQGCVTRIGNSVSMYRFHVLDPIFFQQEICVKLQAMGGGPWDRVKTLRETHAPHTLVTYDDGDIHPIYRSTSHTEPKGYVNFFRQDHYRTVAYFYKKIHL